MAQLVPITLCSWIEWKKWENDGWGTHTDAVQTDLAHSRNISARVTAARSCSGSLQDIPTGAPDSCCACAEWTMHTRFDGPGQPGAPAVSGLELHDSYTAAPQAPCIGPGTCHQDL